MRLILIRHAPTPWNERGLIQGRRDPPLSPSGRALARAWRLPAALEPADWLTSPLRRARETAELLTSRRVQVEPRLVEMAWGRFEGRRLGDLRAEDPDGMAANEALGLDFRPPCGESPRDVAARLTSLARSLAGRSGRVVAVTHKGVMRAALVLATGWDMRARPPLRLERGDALALEVDGSGRISLAGPPLRLGICQA